jgi:hypothetical protein
MEITVHVEDLLITTPVVTKRQASRYTMPTGRQP